METDRRDVPVLARAQDIARAADFQVAHGDRIARAELGVLGNRLQPLAAFVGWRLAVVAEEIGIGALRPAPHPPAQLVELRQAEGVRPVHDQRVGVGDVQARLR